jgi:hypothetical protein
MSCRQTACRVFLSGSGVSHKKPDIALPSAVNGLQSKCRVCRILLGGDSCRKTRFEGGNVNADHILLIRLDLNDARD